jgi:hypothetical protein
MFSQSLHPETSQVPAASPRRLARLANQSLGNQNTLVRIIDHVRQGCIGIQRISPLFRFVEACLTVPYPSSARCTNGFRSILKLLQEQTLSQS